MIHYMRLALQARKSERGATAVEYGLMVALIAVAIIAAVFALGGELTTLFQDVDTQLGNRGAPAGTGT